MDGPAISFGPFRLLAAQRLLLEGETPVRLGSRAFDLLAVLVERAGEVVGKDELIARAWPKTIVEESNLKFQMSALRRAIGDGQGGHRYVTTVLGRGYQFVAPVGFADAPPTPLPPSGVHNLPLQVTRMIGREDAASALVSRLSSHRLVTIVGPGGIGKSTLALAIAERMIAAYEDGAWLVDLAPLGDQRLVPTVVTTVLGLEVRTQASLPGLVAGLKDKRMLLLLDNCEHVIDATASLATAVLSGAPGVSILATSRERLGVAGERQYRLGSLSSPEPSSRLTAAEAEVFPAVQLFVERVTAIVEDFTLTDANAPLVVEICRRLDGLPLAIEFAAPRVAMLGVKGLAAGLHDSLPLLGARRGAALPRHRTMQTLVDWSYGLLSEDEQPVFRALGIFAGAFTVEAGAAVAMEAKTGIDAIDCLADLVAKSLVVADVGGAQPWFRLLETTRAYAIRKLDEAGERERIARRHAEFYRELFERADGEAASRPTAEWLADYAREIDNLRAGLEWAFSSEGDAAIGAALTTAAIPLWMRLSLLDEAHSWVRRALDALACGQSADASREMKLNSALSTALIHSGVTGPDAKAAWTKALEIAENLGDSKYQLRALGGLGWLHFMTDQPGAALALTQRFHALAAKSPNVDDRMSGERLIGVSQHLLGDQASAQGHLERALSHYLTLDDASGDASAFSAYPFNQRVTARMMLARVQWLRGLPDQAMREAAIGVEDARKVGHTMSICYALAYAACPIALLAGDLAAAERYAAMLLDRSAQPALTRWGAFGRCHQAVIVMRRGDVDAGLRLLRASLDEIGANKAALRWVMFESAMAETLGRAGQIAEGLAAVDDALDRTERTAQRWQVAELLRIKGELLLLQAVDGAAAAAEDRFRQALDWARRQGALSWELRAATSLARLLRNQQCSAEATACLQPVYKRFTEGFGTADLVAAKRLLDALSDAARH
jgi:predicted ATPase/DNA-binding winged helix-turn-helix (wHTH) protein